MGHCHYTPLVYILISVLPIKKALDDVHSAGGKKDGSSDWIYNTLFCHSESWIEVVGKCEKSQTCLGKPFGEIVPLLMDRFFFFFARTRSENMHIILMCKLLSFKMWAELYDFCKNEKQKQKWAQSLSRSVYIKQ